MSDSVIGVDAGTAELREADQLVRRLADRLRLPDGTVGCTHPVRVGRPRLAVSFALPDSGPAPGVWERLTAFAEAEQLGAAWGERRLGSAEGAALAAAEHAGREGGRAVVYPGVERLTGTVTIGDLLAGSAIERVSVLAGGDEPDHGDLVRTRGHVRPGWQSGRLVLVLAPAAGGGYTPFEVPDPTPCCADHG